MSTIRNKMLVAALLCGSALMAAPPAAAQFYVGGSLGWSDYKSGNAVPMTSGSVDGEDTGYKIFGGYQFNRNFAFEAAYLDLGKASYTGSVGAAPLTGGRAETTGFNFSAVGTLPLTQNFDVFGKLGMMMWETDASFVVSGVPGSQKNDGNDLTYGVGIAYNFTPNLALRAEWERFKAVDDIDLLSIGIAFKF
jgi:OmpA-OmpF porin, OOP family